MFHGNRKASKTLILMVIVKKGVSVTQATKLRALASDSMLTPGNSLVPFHVGVFRG